VRGAAGPGGHVAATIEAGAGHAIFASARKGAPCLRVNKQRNGKPLRKNTSGKTHQEKHIRENTSGKTLSDFCPKPSVKRDYATPTSVLLQVQRKTSHHAEAWPGNKNVFFTLHNLT
jgi:hypothetical protein